MPDQKLGQINACNQGVVILIPAFNTTLHNSEGSGERLQRRHGPLVFFSILFSKGFTHQSLKRWEMYGEGLILTIFMTFLCLCISVCCICLLFSQDFI